MLLLMLCCAARLEKIGSYEEIEEEDGEIGSGPIRWRARVVRIGA